MALQAETYGQHRATLWNGVGKYFFGSRNFILSAL